MKPVGDSERRGKKTNYIKHADPRDRSGRPKQVWVKASSGNRLKRDLNNVADKKGEKGAVAVKVY